MGLNTTVAWLILIVSGMCETIWAAALGASTLHWAKRAGLFALGTALSMGGLAVALSTIPVSIAYAVWVGVGASVTFAWSVLRGYEKATGLKIAFVCLILAGATGLKVVG